jgi:hypothetical protein
MTEVAQNTLAEHLVEIEAKLAAVLAETGRRLENAPDNPRIKRLSDSPRAFVVSSKELFRTDNWTAFAHDWKAQYRLLQSLIRDRRFAAVRSLLQGESIKAPQQGTVRLAPEVIAHALPILGALPTP